MHPMDINWYFDHDEINDLQIRAINSSENSPSIESRWLKMDRELFERAISSQNPRIEYYNIILKDPLGTEILDDHVVMDNEDFADSNPHGLVESQELFYHCLPSNFSWADMIDHEIEAVGAGTPDQEAAAVSFSYTMGSLGIVGTVHDVDHVANSTTNSREKYSLGLSFNF